MQEAGVADVIKKGGAALGKAAASGVGKVKQGAKAVGKELGNKVTSRKLNSLWKKAGKPTDMASIVNILSQAGISDQQIGTVGKQARIPLEKSTIDNTIDPKLKALADEIRMLDLVDYLKPKLADG